jgi:hypothetical protein
MTRGWRRTEVRRRVLTGEIGKREACRQYQLHWQTLEKILGHVEPQPRQTNGPCAAQSEATQAIIDDGARHNVRAPCT